jgi:ribosomal protein S18 acetylase RimI-like enzyme
LLDYTIEKAKEYHYPYLKLCTDPEEAPEAQQLYKKFGFLFDKVDIDSDSGEEVTILKKNLS